MGLPSMVALMGKRVLVGHILLLLLHRFSRKIIWLEVAKTNNDSGVIAGYFLHAVAQYGRHFIFCIISDSSPLWQGVLGYDVVIEARKTVNLHFFNPF